MNVRPAWLRSTPRSLRGQFVLALSVLSLLILAGGLAAVVALRTSSGATQELAAERLLHMQDAQDMVQRALLIERETARLLTTPSLPALQQSYTAIVEHTQVLDRVVAGLAQASEDVEVLDLHQANQLFRSTANVVAQLRESALQSEHAFAQVVQERIAGLQARGQADAQSLALLLYRLQAADSKAAVDRLQAEFVRLAPSVNAMPAGVRRNVAALRSPSADAIDPDGHDPFSLRQKAINQSEVLRQFHDQLEQQAVSMVSAARLQSAFFDGDYRVALQRLVDTSRRQQRWVLMLLASSLLFAWLVAGVFLGRHVLGRLQQLSRHVQQHGAPDTPLAALARRRDEIGDMAGAVERFLRDRALLELRTNELSRTKEHAVEQGRVLEMIATGAPLPEILERLTLLIECQFDGIRGSVLLLDEDGLHLRHGAGPNLPQAYRQAIDGVRIGPDVGSCGTCAHRREPVMVADIQADPLWTNYRTLAELHGLRSCWSAPILSHQGTVLGTFAMYSAAVREPTPNDRQLIALATRIAGIAIERRRSEERIRYMAHHDELTGLPNRALLHDRMAQALVQARRTGLPVALLFLDLDGFKFINDSFGHPVGDALLVRVAARLSAAVRESDTVARLGGDEFVVMLPDLAQADDALVVAKQILNLLSRPIGVEDRSVHVSASIGVSVSTGDGSSGETLLKQADVAMYRAKQRGRNGYLRYTDEMGLEAVQHMELQTALRQALPLQQFELHYQPQVDLRTGRVNAMEALLRWNHPEFGMISPARFIPLAEETGLIVPIGEWVLKTACTQLKAWHAAGHAGLAVAVNISARQFQGQDVAQMVHRVLGECGLAGRCLELELTEGTLLLDTEAVLQAMRELKSIGVALALDDFGTGYSSLSHLRRFPIDVIKIDQAFTSDVAINADAASITRAILAMARSLGMKTVAEGVETESQLRFMGAHGCDSVQGYYFSRPLPVAAMSALLSQDRRLGAPGPEPARSTPGTDRREVTA